MTDAERLKVAEEVFAAVLPEKVILEDVKAMRHTDGVSWTVYRNAGLPSFLEQGIGLVDLVIRARQKLAAEREAAMTPRERKLRDRVTQIRDYVKNFGDWDKTIIRLCDEALEES